EVWAAMRRPHAKGDRLVSFPCPPASLQPLQPTQQNPDVLRQLFLDDLARCLTQRGAEMLQEVDVVDPGHVFGLLLHADRVHEIVGGRCSSRNFHSWAWGPVRITVEAGGWPGTSLKAHLKGMAGKARCLKL